MWTPSNLKLSTRYTTALSMRMGVCLALFFLQSTISTFVLLTLRQSLQSSDLSDLLPIGCLIVVGEHKCSSCPGGKGQCRVQQRMHHLWICWGGVQILKCSHTHKIIFSFCSVGNYIPRVDFIKEKITPARYYIWHTVYCPNCHVCQSYLFSNEVGETERDTCGGLHVYCSLCVSLTPFV